MAGLPARWSPDTPWLRAVCYRHQHQWTASEASWVPGCRWQRLSVTELDPLNQPVTAPGSRFPRGGDSIRTDGVSGAGWFSLPCPESLLLHFIHSAVPGTVPGSGTIAGAPVCS